jgi:hypothetical protein
MAVGRAEIVAVGKAEVSLVGKEVLLALGRGRGHADARRRHERPHRVELEGEHRRDVRAGGVTEQTYRRRLGVWRAGEDLLEHEPEDARPKIRDSPPDERTRNDEEVDRFDLHVLARLFEKLDQRRRLALAPRVVDGRRDCPAEVDDERCLRPVLGPEPVPVRVRIVTDGCTFDEELFVPQGNGNRLGRLVRMSECRQGQPGRLRNASVSRRDAMVGAAKPRLLQASGISEEFRRP